MDLIGEDGVGQRPNELTPHASPQHYLGAEMRAWRSQRGLSLGTLGKAIVFNSSYMARVERGDQAASADLVRAYDSALGASGSLVRLHESITQGASLDALRTHHVANPRTHVSNPPVTLAGESDGEAPSSEGLSVPVRTDDGRIIFVSLSRRALIGALGAGAAIAAASELPAAARTSSLSASGANPIELLKATRKVLIDNDNRFGPARVIPVVQQQIAAIKDLRADRRGSDRRQLLQLQTQYSELCGWLYQDLGDFRAAQHWMREALETSHMSGDTDLTTYILARRSQLAGDMRDPIEAVDVAEAAEDLAAPQSRLAVVAATYGAHGHALRSDPSMTQQAYEHALNLHANMDPDPNSPWGVWLDAAYIEVQRAHSLAVLGDHRGAAEGFRSAISRLPAGYHRDRGVYLAREAVALASAGEAEQAASVGLQALSIGAETGSARINRELAQLDDAMTQWRSVPSVADFKDAMTAAVLQQA
ncbi:helix-turn-helix domain-containing protein [Streptomyces sp. A3M-1-3]|uniref:helix-turn-helix domain-containing protein n=1 Tax=Streptomyces sp. A3M-1-3 TaxID=2962044 RepID=UPI0020B69E1F|nr:helix-turn-helix transcriptional regulator [Streptomyces sp. A3M-1-3]MCP3820319.1 helix-turn-helix domain-containing protein [Streptomyces sp. A3M-1-3]